VNRSNDVASGASAQGQPSFKTSWKLLAWFVVAALVAIASDFLLRDHPEWTPALRAACALSPIVPCALYARSYARFVRGMDELQRRIQAESRLIGCLGTLFVVTAIHVLNLHGVPLPAGLRGVNFVVVLIVAGIWSRVAAAVISRRYQ
jgi:hypothetical protein